MKQFQYTALDSPDQIRLVTILPTQENSQDDKEAEFIQLTLSAKSCQDSFSYQALSYTWGDPSIKQRILINDGFLDVTQNLGLALRQLRQPCEATENPNDTVPIWIDAICINQSDIPERNQQVRMMRKIYQFAERVLIWLGPEGEDSDYAFRFVEWLNNLSGSSLWYTRQKVEALLRSDENLRGWKAMDGLFARPYWKRAWIWQEIALVRKIVVKSGNREVTWKRLLRFVHITGEFWDLISTRLNQTALPIPLNGINHPSRLDAANEANKDNIRDVLDTIILENRACEATDPQDKIFAFLGLAVDADALGIPVDYASTTKQVYTDAFKRLTTSAQSIELICVSQHPHQERGLPTWLPDWSIRQPKLNVGARGLWNSWSADSGWQYTPRENAFERQMYRASGRTVSSFAFEENDSVLSVKGLAVDAIEVLVPGSPVGLPTSWLQTAMESTKARQTYGGEDGVRNAFWRSIVTDRIGASSFDGTTKPAPEKYGAAFDAWRGTEKLIEVDERKLTGTETRAASSVQTDPGLLSSRLGIGNEILELIPEFSGFVDMVIKGRKFAITTLGHIGLVPQVAREGDTICLLLGCTVPVVLHQVEEHYWFAGDAYIHGMMNGEALPSSWELDARTFRIR